MIERFLLGIAVVVGGLFGIVVVLVVVLHVIGVLHLYRVPSSSMEPTLHCARPDVGCEGAHSDRILVLKYVFASPARGDLVAFRTPPLAEVRCGAGGVFIKRVVGLPGERFEERGGEVYIDGKRLSEPYIQAERRDYRTIPPTTIGAGSYFVLGDNRESSCDSRSWGTVPKKNLIGKVVATYWPPGRVTFR